MDKETHGARVKAAILAAGLALWRVDPASVSARRIGERIGLTHSGVLYHFGNVETMRAAIAAQAVTAGDTVVVPMLIAAKHPAVADLPGAERARYLAGC